MGTNNSRFLRRVKAAIGLLVSYPMRLGSKIALSAIPIDSQIDRTAALDSRVRFYRSELGRYSYVGRGSFVESAVIGSFCSIAGDCFIGGSGHPLNRVSTSPVFCKGGNILHTNFAEAEFVPHAKTTIGHDVWIGQGVKIRAGITVGTGAVVGMGSVVTKDIGPYEIWAGNPARMIRKRFSETTIERLIESHWWEWSETKLHEKADFFERIITED